MYGITTHVPAPSEAYHAAHQAVLDVIAEQGGGGGLVLHLAYPTAGGFDIVEVWETREHAELFNSTVVPVAMQRAGMPDGAVPRVEEFEPLGVMVPPSEVVS